MSEICLWHIEYTGFSRRGKNVWCISFYGKYFNTVVVVDFLWWFNDLHAEWLGDRLKCVFNPNIILCG